jgi:hypothetical protein
MRKFRHTVGALFVLLLLAAGCVSSGPENELKAAQTDKAIELIGGPSSMGQVGDYLLKNDKVRFIIADTHHSWSFGIFGGSLLDADRVRNDSKYQHGTGLDSFAELFPTVNLVTPNPQPDEVVVVSDGSDGDFAAIRVTGEGTMMFDILKILSNNLLTLLFSELKVAFEFETTYRLEPGNEYLEITTAVTRKIPEDAWCAENVDDYAGDDSCSVDCTEEGKYVAQAYKLQRFTDDIGVVHTCPVCVCEDAKQLPTMTQSEPMLQYIAGDIHLFPELLVFLQDLVKNLGPEFLVFALGMEQETAETTLEFLSDFLAVAEKGQYSGGIVGGDFLFFGAKTNVFLPGLGFDESQRIFDDLYEGRDSLTYPMAFDFAAAIGKDISYVYFTKDPPNAEEGVRSKVLIPLITSSATVIIGSGKQCSQGDVDDATCDDIRRWHYTRYLGVGKGDIGSAVDVLYKAKFGLGDNGWPVGVGRIKGNVFWDEGNMPIHHADVFLVNHPPEDCQFDSYEQLLACNAASTQQDVDGDGEVDVPGMPGIVNHWKTDVGIDPLHDGSYGGWVMPGKYVVVARHNEAGISALVPVTVEAGQTNIVHAYVRTRGTVSYRVTDDSGYTVPAKIVFYSLDDADSQLRMDGNRKVELGDSRYQHGIRSIHFTHTGKGSVDLEWGCYRVIVSRGLEYSIVDKPKLCVGPGQNVMLEANLVREVDTTGWLGGDYHLHAAPSMDSGLPLETRIITNAAEGLEMVVSTDHDILVDYEPYIRELGLEHWMTSMVGTELSTLELGHINAYPLKYEYPSIPDHGAIDWVCMNAQEIFDSLRGAGLISPEKTVVQANHPTDGVMGYFSQMGLNPYNLDRPMQVFGFGIGGFAPMVDEYLGIAKGLLGNYPGLQHFLDNNEIDLSVLPNPSLKTVSCDFDAIEVMNAKRFEFLHVPTVKEVNDFNRCILAIREAGNPVDLFDASVKAKVMDICPELQSPDECQGELDRDTAQRCAWAKNITAEIADACGRDGIAVRDCKEAARFAVAKYSIRVMLQRTPVEHNDKFMALTSPPEVDPSEFCSLEHAVAMDVPDEMQEGPCTKRYGVLDLWFRFLNHGLFATGMGNSDSHGIFFEAGLPRTYVMSSTDAPHEASIEEQVDHILAGRTLSTSGPFLTFTVEGEGPGSKAVLDGDTVDLKMKIQTPSWFGIDRVEIYRNGLLEKVLYTDAMGGDDAVLASDPTLIVDFDGTVNLPAPDQDSWYVVLAMGLNDENLLEPVYTTPARGHLLLPEIISLAFGALLPEGINLPLSPAVPDYFPMMGYAITNPVFVDVDDNGYFAPEPWPIFCEHECTPVMDENGKPTKSDCPAEAADLLCLEDSSSSTGGVCGLNLEGQCVYEPMETAFAPLTMDAEHSPFLSVIPQRATTLKSSKESVQMQILKLMALKFRNHL